jgi:acetyl-CoA synthetase
VFAYCRDELGVPVNEMFGQTEINYVVGNCSRYWPAKARQHGQGLPGPPGAVIDDDGHECPRGCPATWRCTALTCTATRTRSSFSATGRTRPPPRAKYTGDWCRTGDVAVRDADGYLWYQGRADDVFKAAGYRIGPSEIENCLVKHPAVANAAVVPKPDRRARRGGQGLRGACS